MKILKMPSPYIFLALVVILLVGFFVLKKPVRGLFLAAFFIPFCNPNLDVGFTIELAHFILLLTLVCFVLKNAVTNKKLMMLSCDRSILLFLMFVFVTTLGLMAFRTFSGYEGVYGGGFRAPNLRPLLQMLKFFLLVVVYFLTINLIENERHILALIKTLLISMFVVSLYGFYEFFGAKYGWPFVLTQYNALTGQFYGESFTYTDTVTRISSVCVEPRHLAAFLVPLIVMIVTFGSVGMHPLLFKKKWFTYVLLAVLLIALVLTFARSGWIMFLICIFSVPPFVCSLYWKNRQSLKIWIRNTFVVSVVFISLIVVTGLKGESLIIKRLSQIKMLFSRYEMFGLGLEKHVELYKAEAALRIFRKHPFIGVGVGNFSYYFIQETNYPLKRIEGLPGFIRITVETGLLGLGLFCWFVFGSLRYVLRVFRQIDSGFHRKIIAASLALFLCSLICMLFEEGPAIRVFLFLGILKAATRFGLKATTSRMIPTCVVSS